MTAPEDPNGLREALARAEAEAMERAEVEAELMAGIPHNPAPPPIPVRGSYFLIECEHCGWVGSSEQGGTFCGDWGDSDVYCPVCDQTMLCDGPNEADAAKHGQAVFERITAAEARALAAEAENTRLKAGMEALGAALKLAEDVMSRPPLSTMRIWPNGTGSHEGITTIREALATLSPKEHGDASF